MNLNFMKRFLPSTIFLQVSIVAMSMSSSARAAENGLRLDDMNGRVAYLYSISGTTSTIARISGSGFFVSDKDGAAFLVTASHVARSLGRLGHLVVRSTGTLGEDFVLSDLAMKNEVTWVTNPVADVSVLRLKERLPRIDWSNHFIPIEYLETQDEAPHRTQQLVTLGFPLNLGVFGKFSPITKLVLPASDIFTYPRGDTGALEDFFAVDSPSIEGYSGAAVLAFPSMIPYGYGEITLGDLEFCAGLVHGSLPDRHGDKLGFIVPSKYIVETIRIARTK